VRYAISNSFGFGGHNACLAIGRYEAAAEGT
jgi:3-oxoacyl-(acyl-carrier-protein) synthase